VLTGPVEFPKKESYSIGLAFEPRLTKK